MLGRPVRVELGRRVDQTLADQLHQGGIVQQRVHRLQQVVFEQRGLPRQGQVEQTRLARGGSDHSVIDYIE